MSSATLPPMEYEPEVRLFVTGEPCALCSKLIHHAGIEKVLVIDGGYAGANGVTYLEDMVSRSKESTVLRTLEPPPKLNPMKSRSESLVNARRIVIKIGSALLTQSSINLLSRLPPKSAHCKVKATTSSSSHPARLPSPVSTWPPRAP